MTRSNSVDFWMPQTKVRAVDVDGVTYIQAPKEDYPRCGACPHEFHGLRCQCGCTFVNGEKQSIPYRCSSCGRPRQRDELMFDGSDPFCRWGLRDTER